MERDRDEDGLDSTWEQVRSYTEHGLQSRLRRQWGRWMLRLAIGCGAVAAVITTWPDLWWIALVYAPFPLASAAILLRLRSNMHRTVQRMGTPNREQ